MQSALFKKKLPCPFSVLDKTLREKQGHKYIHCRTNCHRVSEWLLFNDKWTIFQLYYGKNKLHSIRRCSLCTKPTCLIFYNATSLKQLSAGRHVVPLGHFILIPRQPVCSCSLILCAKRRNSKCQFYTLVWPDKSSNPWSTALKASMLTITPQTSHRSCNFKLNMKVDKKANVPSRPQGLGASEKKIIKKYYIILQGGELTCFHFFKSSC
jgi:hypothetical protein